MTDKALKALVGEVLAPQESKGGRAVLTENILKPIKEHFEKATGIKLQIIPYP